MSNNEKYDGKYVQLTAWEAIKEEKKTHYWIFFYYALFSAVFISETDWIAVGYTTLAFAIFWSIGICISILVNRKKFILSEVGVIEKEADEARKEEDRKLKELKSKEFFERWYVRYLIGGASLALAWYIVEIDLYKNKKEWIQILVPGALALYGAYLFREISIVVIGIAILYWGVNLIASIPTSIAVIIGAIIIAQAIYHKSK